jgi:hypothetical protein
VAFISDIPFGHRKFSMCYAGQVAFLAQLDGDGISEQNDIGVWATTRNGVLTLLAREGDSILVAPGDIRTVAELLFVGGNGDGSNFLTGLNDDGLVTFSARFTDGTSGLFVARLAIPEPSGCRLLVAAIVMLLPRVTSRKASS